jgi:hypothetical protein
MAASAAPELVREQHPYFIVENGKVKAGPKPEGADWMIVNISDPTHSLIRRATLAKYTALAAETGDITMEIDEEGGGRKVRLNEIIWYRQIPLKKKEAEMAAAAAKAAGAAKKNAKEKRVTARRTRKAARAQRAISMAAYSRAQNRGFHVPKTKSAKGYASNRTNKLISTGIEKRRTGLSRALRARIQARAAANAVRANYVSRFANLSTRKGHGTRALHANNVPSLKNIRRTAKVAAHRRSLANLRDMIQSLPQQRIPASKFKALPVSNKKRGVKAMSSTSLASAIANFKAAQRKATAKYARLAAAAPLPPLPENNSDL